MDLDADACYRAICTRDARFDGILFVGVKTTGIYCRPICPARTPKRENLVFFWSAAAAQAAGFRPCLRCRPETAPELAAWRGTSNTVSRALALIELGALDNARVDALASRLGIGERQLRRLFNEHIGASPVAVGQTRRVLLAKQLIHETNLSMTDIAMAAGFGSIRRFNEVFRALFGRPPRLLRRNGADGARAGTVTILIRYRPPYDWSAMLGFLAARSIRGLEVVEDREYRRAIEIDGSHGLLSVQPHDGNALRAEIRFPKIAKLPAIIGRLRRVFDLGADPQAIAALLARDAALAPRVRARPGLRVPGAWDPFELAVRAVLGQQITVSAARGLAGRLVERYGDALNPASASPGLTHVFPRPAQLARADLTSLGMPRARARALSSLAAAVDADPGVLAMSGSLEAAIARLRQLPGIGEWTAQYIAMRVLREPDAFPAADVGLLRAMADRHGRRPTPKALLLHAERWRPWRAYAAQHLWTQSA
jgi:AraC family transcriptional regulator of adaptative response / DNA-3-methyladenine glycosylase II